MSVPPTSSDRPPEDGRLRPAVARDARGAFSNAGRRFRGLASGLASAVVLAALLWPGDGLPEIDAPGLDKLAHAALFALWSLALGFDFRVFRARPALLVATAAAFGLIGEGLQTLAVARSFDLADLAADALGGALAAIALAVVRARGNRSGSGGADSGEVSSNG